jgi:hypothetical protein
VLWQDELYLEDGLHRALRTALHGRPTLHARVLDLAALESLVNAGKGAAS